MNYQTTYSYDVLDNLLQVNQGSQTPRTFQYDSLKRLTQATNPESGTIDYKYDDDGNLVEKQDARQLNSTTRVTTTYEYDELNRVTSKSYNDGTPNVSYFYDNQATPSAPTFDRGQFSKGRLVAVTYGAAGSRTGTYYGYDTLGRVTQSVQQTDARQPGATQPNVQAYGVRYEYNRAGALTAETYPSGRVVKTAYDGAGRILTLSGTMGTQTKSYASQFAYASQGAVSKVKLGNGLWEHTSFNSRLQPTEIGLGLSALVSDQLKLTYDYGTATANNGNLMSQTINVPAITNVRSQLSVKQSYTYDSLNRLASAREVDQANNNAQTFKQVYSYTDASGEGGEYGNLRLNWAQTSANVRPEQSSQVPSISSATNRITSDGYGYDAAGNLTAAPDKMSGGPQHDYTFDAENRMVLFDASADHVTRYTYDGEGRRVKKVIGSGSLAVTSTYVYDAKGKLVAEYATNTAGSELGIRYLTADHLGNTRIVTDGLKVVTTQAAANSAVKARYDYLPFGDEINSSIGGRSTIPGYVTSDTTRQKFTSKERDVETGLDYFGARYYASAGGRFISCDPINVTKRHIANPQRWNLYTYVNNSPLALVDPDGRDPQGNGGGRVIDVFITHTPQERGVRPDGKPYRGENWQGLQKEGRSKGVTVNVYYHTENSTGLGASDPTAARMKESAHTPGRIVIIAGHSDASDGGVQGARAVGNNIYTGDGLFGRAGVETATNVEPLPKINAQAIVVATCDISGAVGPITSQMSEGSALVYNDSGPDGLTPIYTDENMAYAAAQTFVNGGNVEQAANAMRAVQNSPTHQNIVNGAGRVNEGDQVRIARPQNR